MKVITSEEMYAIEEETIRNTGIPALLLMERAAMSLATHCISALRDGGKVVIAAGSGNNGGDGFALARILFLKHVDIAVVFMGDENNLSGAAKTNFDIAKNLRIPFVPLSSGIFKSADVIVDALLGIGTSRPLSGGYKIAVNAINESGRYVIAVDVPSGVYASTGHVPDDLAVRAHKTVTFAYPKVGLLLYPGLTFAGEVVVEDIGIPNNTAATSVKVATITEKEVSSLLPKRFSRSNKGSYGNVFIMAGCDEMPGACVLSARAAYKSGAGLVRVCSTKAVTDIAHIVLPEAVTSILPEADGMMCGESAVMIMDKLPKADVIVLGPGLGRGGGVSTFVRAVLSEASSPIVLDADGLNAIDGRDLSAMHTLSVITPHPGEMSRLTGLSITDILRDTIGTARNFAAAHGVVTVLKDARTIVAAPTGEIYINTSGHSAMAKAGAGDVLTGIIAAYIAQGLAPFHAAGLACFMHGQAGERAGEALGDYGVLAGELADYIGG